MGSQLRSTLAIVLLALPASAGQRGQSFQVGAIVVRSAQVRALVGPSGATRLRLVGARVLAVQIDSAPLRAVQTEEIALPDGVRRVTIHY